MEMLVGEGKTTKRRNDGSILERKNKKWPLSNRQWNRRVKTQAKIKKIGKRKFQGRCKMQKVI